MSADLLRRAGALMRERAEAATEGTWRVVPIDDRRSDIRTEPELGYDYRGTAVATAADSSFGAVPNRDAAHIASWHPAVALYVAGWLESMADHFENEALTEPACLPHEARALAVARAYLGSVQ